MTISPKKYYAKKICQQFNHLECVERWAKHLEIPEQERNIEDGAIIIAQTLSNPKLDPNMIYMQLDSIAQGANNRLGVETCPDLRFEILNKFFFQELGFRGFDSEYFYPSKSFIHQVLQSRRGIQISLALVYCVVARRLHIPIAMIAMPRHFLTRYEGDGKYKNYYIDVFSGGEILSSEELEKRLFPDRYATVSNSLEVYTRLLRNLIEEYNGTGQVDNMMNALNQSIFIQPQQEELAYRIVIHTNYTGNLPAAKMDLQFLTSLGSITVNGEQMLRQKIEDAEERLRQETLDAQTEIQPKMRSSEILYSVGHVFRHARNGYRGVIYGWQNTCNEEGMILMSSGEEITDLGSNQPFYMALIDTRDRPVTTTVVSQQNILLQPGDIIQHPEVGFYFKAFRAGNYIPNQTLAKEYPFDAFSRVEVIPLVQFQPSSTKRTAAVLEP